MSYTSNIENEIRLPDALWSTVLDGDPETLERLRDLDEQSFCGALLDLTRGGGAATLEVLRDQIEPYYLDDLS